MSEHSAADIEGWVAAMRKEIAVQPPAPGTIRTPDDIIHQLEVIDAVAGKALWTVKEADKVRAKTSEALLQARAKAQGEVEGKTVDDRKAEVDLATVEESVAAETAAIAYRYARGLAELIDSRKSSLQTQAKLVLATYQLAGTSRSV